MITINRDRELVDVQDWAEVLQLPGFQKDLDPKDHQLDSIIGQYMVRDPIPCGLSNCHTPHGKGYIVTTKAGLATNIGKDCGKRIFGIDFQAASKQFDRDVRDKRNRDRLNSFAFSVEDVEAKIHDLRKQQKGANWIYEHLPPLANTSRGIPEVVRKLREMAKSGNHMLTREREATENEIALEEGRTGRAVQRPHIVSEPVAEIAGVEALKPEYNIRTLLIDDLETNLRKFQEHAVETMISNDLVYWCKWADTVELTIEKVEAAIKYGRQLLDRNNLEVLMTILQKREDKARFKTYLNSLD